jgi:hypothetical protein
VKAVESPRLRQPASDGRSGTHRLRGPAFKGGQEAAIEAVRKFVDTVDKTLEEGEGPSQREEIVDSALKMAERLVETQYDFLRKVVRSAGESLGASSATK